jgi:glutathione synthase/RimK-type ligase-like ATP-grasp enzyme
MKIAIVTFPTDYSVSHIKQEFEKLHISVKIILYSQTDEDDLSGFDYIIIRYSPKYVVKMKWLIKKFDSRIILNKKALKIWQNLQDKFQQYLFYKENQIPVPNSKEIKNWSELEKIKFPYVIKKRISSRGEKVFFVNNRDDLKKISGNFDCQDFFLQEYITSKKDYRIIILDGKVIVQVIRKITIRQRKDGPQFGVKPQSNTVLSRKILDLAKKVARISQCEFAGVDAITDQKGQVYFLECNIASQFISTEKKAHKNVARTIVEYLLKKISKVNQGQSWTILKKSKNELT